MPSIAAQNYFNTFPADEQARIRASWGGADLMDQWYNNAVAAGAVPGQGNAPEAQGATAPTAGKPTAAWLRAYAVQQGWPEDFARFDDATVQGWINQFWDPTANMFRSSRGAGGTFFKPTDCPDGMVPGGPNENSPCVSGQPGAGAGSQGAAGSAVPGTAVPAQPRAPRTLQDILMASLGQRNLRTGAPSLFATWASGRSPLSEQYDVEGIPIPLPADDVFSKGLVGGGGAVSANTQGALDELGAAIPDVPYVAPPAAPTPAAATGLPDASTAQALTASAAPAVPSQPKSDVNAQLPDYLSQPMEGDVVLGQDYLPDLSEQLTGKKRQKKAAATTWW